MKPRLRITVTSIPTADYERLRSEAMDALADALAELFITQAREEVAAELGVAPEQIDREQRREVVEALERTGGGR